MLEGADVAGELVVVVVLTADVAELLGDVGVLVAIATLLVEVNGEGTSGGAVS